VVDDVFLSSDDALRVELREETSETVLFAFYMAADSSFHLRPQGQVKLATADKKLMIRTSGAGAIRATAIVHSEA
jgi:hypothetical protein